MGASEGVKRALLRPVRERSRHPSGPVDIVVIRLLARGSAGRWAHASLESPSASEHLHECELTETHNHEGRSTVDCGHRPRSHQPLASQANRTAQSVPPGRRAREDTAYERDLAGVAARSVFESSTSLIAMMATIGTVFAPVAGKVKPWSPAGPRAGSSDAPSARGASGAHRYDITLTQARPRLVARIQKLA
jgi:hypothetical protein